MTKTQAIEELNKLAKSADTEAAHVEADDILMAFLAEQGYGDVAAAFARIDKHYA